MPLNTIKLAQLKTRLEEMREEIKKEARSVFTEGVKDVFESFPQLHAISWRQYTPYWCDGDICEFSAQTYEPNLYIKVPQDMSAESWPEAEGQIELEDGTLVAYYDGWNMPSEFRDIQKAIGKFLGELSNDDFLAMFGDHAEVVIYADGTQRVMEYDHE